MKIYINYIKQVAVFMLAMALTVSCVQWETPVKSPVDAAGTVTLTLSSVGDSAIMVDVNASKDGFISVLLFEGTGNDVPTEFDDRESMLSGNVSSLGFESVEQKGMAVSQVAFYDGISQDMSYEVMAVANNGDGMVSEVAVIQVMTSDTHAPMLLEWDPPSAYDAVLEANAPITLYYDEAVAYDENKVFTFTTLYTGMSVPAADVVVDGDMVEVYTPDLPEGDYVMLSWPEGAVIDMSGNMADSMASYLHPDGYILGVYTRRVRPPRDAVSVAPEIDSIASGGDIVVTFDDGVAPDGSLAKGDIVLKYYSYYVDEDGYWIYEFDHSTAVDPATLVFDGMTVTIPQAESVAYGWEVELEIAEAAFDIGVYVPSAEITAGWWVY